MRKERAFRAVSAQYKHVIQVARDALTCSVDVRVSPSKILINITCPVITRIVKFSLEVYGTVEMRCSAKRKTADREGKQDRK